MPTAFLQYFSVRNLQPAAKIVGEACKAVDGEDALDDGEADTVSELPYEEDHGG